MTAHQLKPRTKATMVMGTLPPEPPARWRWWLLAGTPLVLLMLAAGVRLQTRAAAETTHDEAVRSVTVVSPEPAPDGGVTLPATLQPDQATDLLPRVDGFVKAWKAEIGARVRAGQLLAEIDAPELDQEVLRAEAQAKQTAADLQQARAELDEAKSDVELVRATLDRSRADLGFAVAQAQRDRKLFTARAVSRE